MLKMCLMFQRLNRPVDRGSKLCNHLVKHVMVALSNHLIISNQWVRRPPGKCGQPNEL